MVTSSHLNNPIRATKGNFLDKEWDMTILWQLWCLCGNYRIPPPPPPPPPEPKKKKNPQICKNFTSGMHQIAPFYFKNCKAPSCGRGDTPFPHPPLARSLRSLKWWNRWNPSPLPPCKKLATALHSVFFFFFFYQQKKKKSRLSCTCKVCILWRFCVFCTPV